MKIFFLLGCLCGSLLLNAQYELSGHVKNQNGEPLIGASVFFSETQFATITDEQGKYSISEIPEDTYQIKVTFIGYRAFIEEIEITENQLLDIVLTGSIFNLDEIEISANSLDKSSPFSFSTMDATDVKFENLGQDIPFLLEQTPSVVVTSDAGAGIGYTGMRIRGSDPTRVNVTINGVPLNDSESHGVFWVNLPDIASSTDKIQVQRGVGPSTNGAGAFGGTIALKTSAINQNPYIDLQAGYGSFNTKRVAASFGTGLLNDAYSIEGRYSWIESDGYVDRASSKLNSWFFSAAKIKENYSLKLNAFSGKERTYQSWFGVPEARLSGDQNELLEHYNNNSPFTYQTVNDSLNLFESDRRYNYYTYQNQVDDYRQTHLQLIYNAKLSERVNYNLIGHYTKGKGFFEQFILNQDFGAIGIDPIPNSNGELVSSADVVTRKWLSNDFYGFIFNAEIKLSDKLHFHIGSGVNRYVGDHFGKAVFAFINSGIAPFLLNENFDYYRSTSKKIDANVFGKVSYKITQNLSLFGDLQMRHLDYVSDGTDDDQRHITIDTTYTFINPKLGLTYNLNENSSVYFSYAKANREPIRSDFVDAVGSSIPQPESLTDLEFGYRRSNESMSIEANVFLMDYKNQLVVTGAINDVGAAIRQNVEKSSRLGVELSGRINLSNGLIWKGNVTYSQSKIDQFVERIQDYNTGIDIQNTYQDTDIAFSPNLVAATTLTYKPLDEVSISWIGKYVGEQFLDNTQQDSRRISDYLINDLVLAYNSSTIGVTAYEIKLMVNNLLNQKYVSNGYTFNYMTDKLIVENYFYPQAGINFLLGVNFIF